MTRRAGSEGKISTFFSYKGGVGRTMAVANVGFIAAMAGQRVLLMDWDLEAPGLPVYFRGVTSHKAASRIRRATGILNLVNDWCEALDEAHGHQEVEPIFDRFTGDARFAESACPLLPPSRLPKGGKLDIITAGARMIGSRHPVPYAEVLSAFDWPSFFSEYAGGFLLSSLRRWAKRNYDLILIDSRTGLADVAGICTMQLPDEVVLCFVLNRQNTEGVADTAAAVLAARGDEIAVRVAPMRVSQNRPSEEADARARAQREFRHAGLEQSRIEYDMVQLSIAAAPNVPFYEALAPFFAEKTTADPLTYQYLGLAQELTGTLFEAPRVDDKWLEEVRRRLQPRMTTVDYLVSLESADPDRALDELDRFLDGALDADPNRELEPEYVIALVRTAINASDWTISDTGKDPARGLAEKAVRLLEQLNEMSDGDWRLPLVDALEEIDARWSHATGKDLIEKYRQRDAILRIGPQSAKILIRRARIGAAIAAEERRGKNLNASEDALKSSETLLNQIPRTDDAESDENLTLAWARLYSERARLYEADDARGNAAAEWRRVLDLIPEPESRSARIFVADAHLGLAKAMPTDLHSADHVIAAGHLWRPSILRDLKAFSSACRVIFKASDAGTKSVEFALAVFDTKQSNKAASAARIGLSADPLEFSLQLQRLVNNMDSRNPRIQQALEAVSKAAEAHLSRVRRLYAIKSDTDWPEKLVSIYAGLYDTLAAAGAPARVTASLKQQIDLLLPTRSS